MVRSPQYTGEWVKPIKAAKSPRRPTRRRAVDAICLLFEPLVKAQARAYRQHVFGAELEDLEQVARVGLLDAVASYNAKKGPLPTHVVWSIRNALSKYVETLGNPVKAPAWMVRRLPKLRRLVVVMAHELLREPTREELATRMKLNVQAIESMQAFDAGPAVMPAEYGKSVGSSDPKHRRLHDLGLRGRALQW